MITAVIILSTTGVFGFMGFKKIYNMLSSKNTECGSYCETKKDTSQEACSCNS